MTIAREEEGGAMTKEQVKALETVFEALSRGGRRVESCLKGIVMRSTSAIKPYSRRQNARHSFPTWRREQSRRERKSLQMPETITIFMKGLAKASSR